MNGQSVSSYPTKRLRFLTHRGLSDEQRQILTEVAQVTFIPMEKIGEQGELDCSLSREIDDVQNGYTQFFDGDVLVAKITPCFENGKGALVSGTLNGVGFGTTELHVLRPTKEIDARFLYYSTTSNQFRKHGEAVMFGSAGQKRVSEEFVRNFRVLVPPLEQQRAIANYLDRETARLDELVASKEQVLIFLREKRRALITRAVTRGLDPYVPLHYSGIPWLGDIPAHWKIRRLKHVGKPTIGLTFDSSEMVLEKEGVLVLRASNIKDQHIVLEDNIYVKVDIPQELITRVGDILICSRSGSRALIGKSAMIDSASAGITFGVFMTLFRSTYNSFLYFVFNSPIFEYQAGAFSTSTINQLTIETLENLKVPIPPFSEQRSIVSHIETETQKLDELIQLTNQSITLLKERRVSLISATVTGQIDVEQGV